MISAQSLYFVIRQVNKKVQTSLETMQPDEQLRLLREGSNMSDHDCGLLAARLRPDDQKADDRIRIFGYYFQDAMSSGRLRLPAMQPLLFECMIWLFERQLDKMVFRTQITLSYCDLSQEQEQILYQRLMTSLEKLEHTESLLINAVEFLNRDDKYMKLRLKIEKELNPLRRPITYYLEHAE